MNFPNPLIYVTSDPQVFDLVSQRVFGAVEYHEQIEQFMVDINAEYPLDGGLLVPQFAEGVLIGVTSHTHPLVQLEGWERSPLIDCYLPEIDHRRGQKWAKRLDELPSAPEQITGEALRMPLVIGNGLGAHMHGVVHLMQERGQVAVVWPVRDVAPAMPEILSLFGGVDIWQEMPRSEFFAALEHYEARLTAKLEELAAADAEEQEVEFQEQLAGLTDDASGAELTDDDLDFLREHGRDVDERRSDG